MIIFIRGLPGSGKTAISNKLAEKVHWDVIHVDSFKKEFIEQNPKAFFIEEVVPFSYKKTLEALEKYKNKNVIVEEIFRSKDFVNSVLDFLNKNNIKYQWFIIERDIGKIIEANNARKSKVKNTAESLELMKQQINNSKTKGEITINNKDIDESVREIITYLDRD